MQEAELFTRAMPLKALEMQVCGAAGPAVWRWSREERGAPARVLPFPPAHPLPPLPQSARDTTLGTTGGGSGLGFLLFEDGTQACSSTLPPMACDRHPHEGVGV